MNIALASLLIIPNWKGLLTYLTEGSRQLRALGNINVKKFSKSKSCILHLGQNKTGQKYKLAEDCLERSPAERDLGVLVSSSSV